MSHPPRPRPRPRTLRTAAHEALLRTLAKQPATAQALHEVTNVPATTVHQALARMTLRGLVANTPSDEGARGGPVPNVHFITQAGRHLLAAWDATPTPEGDIPA